MPKTKNILSVDFEDYFCDLPFIKWDEYENRVVETTPALLELFSKYKAKATFFIVGYFVFRQYQQPVKRWRGEIIDDYYNKKTFTQIIKSFFIKK